MREGAHVPAQRVQKPRSVKPESPAQRIPALHVAPGPDLAVGLHSRPHVPLMHAYPGGQLFSKPVQAAPAFAGESPRSKHTVVTSVGIPPFESRSRQTQ